jgi:hypothetical protein
LRLDAALGSANKFYALGCGRHYGEAKKGKDEGRAELATNLWGARHHRALVPVAGQIVHRIIFAAVSRAQLAGALPKWRC